MTTNFYEEFYSPNEMKQHLIIC